MTTTTNNKKSKGNEMAKPAEQNMFHDATTERELIQLIVGCASLTLTNGVFDSDKAAEVARHGHDRLLELRNAAGPKTDG